MFKPYNSPYATPLPTNARPTAVTAAPNVNYPDVSSGGVMALANATSNFALRFVGERLTQPYSPNPKPADRRSPYSHPGPLLGPQLHSLGLARLGFNVWLHERLSGRMLSPCGAAG